VALAGPASNFILALVLSLIVRLAGSPLLSDVFGVFIFVNLSLMIFNLIPIPPLDGSKLLRLVLPETVWLTLEQYGFILILVFVFLFNLGSQFIGLIQSLYTLLTGQTF
jgi:Zn-dependent protease